MPTIQQLVRKGRKQMVEKSKSRALIPVHKSAVFVFVFTLRPQKAELCHA